MEIIQHVTSRSALQAPVRSCGVRRISVTRPRTHCSNLVDRRLGGVLAEVATYRVVRRQARTVVDRAHARRDPGAARDGDRRWRRGRVRRCQRPRSRARRSRRPPTRSAPRRSASCCRRSARAGRPRLVQMTAEGVHPRHLQVRPLPDRRGPQEAGRRCRAFGLHHRCQRWQEAARGAEPRHRGRHRSRRGRRRRDQPRPRPDQRARRGHHAEPALAAEAAGDRQEAQGLGHGARSSTPKKCDELGMGMFLAVGQGSDQESRFIHLTYKPAKKPKKKIVLHRQGRHVRLGRLLAQAVERRWRT